MSITLNLTAQSSYTTYIVISKPFLFHMLCQTCYTHIAGIIIMAPVLLENPLNINPGSKKCLNES